MNTVFAIKQKMQQEFIAGKRVPVTTLLVPEHNVLANRTQDVDGYSSLIVGVGKSKSPAKKSLAGFLKKKALEFVPQRIREIKLGKGETFDNATLDLSSILVEKSKVTVIAKSKGKGFAGVMKRHGFSGGPRTHGQSDRERAPGSVGRGTTPGRIVKGKRMAGHMGNENVSVKNLIIIGFDPATSVLKLKGAVPGSQNSFVTIKINS